MTEISEKFKFFQPLVDQHYMDKTSKVREIRKLPVGYYAVRVDRPSFSDEILVYNVIHPAGPAYKIKGAFVLPPGKDIRYLEKIAPEFYKKEK